MFVLIDYDNLDRKIAPKGVRYVTEKVIAALEGYSIPLPDRIEFRLYGGWYDRSGPTRKAQEISSILQRDFPFVHRSLSHVSQSNKTKIQAVLAYALLCDPGRHLLHTYRIRETVKGIKAVEPTNAGCMTEACGLRNIRRLFDDGTCPEDGCNIKITDLLSKAEQKLVDVMLATDLIHIAYDKASTSVVVVSSDEDFWPALRQAIALSPNVIHIQAQLWHKTPPHYCQHLGARYVQLQL